MYKTIGIHIEKAANGTAQSRMEPAANFCWPFPGQPHGGVISTFMDTTMGWAVHSKLNDSFNCTTVNLNIQYTLPAKGTLFTCTAKVSHQTSRSSFVRGEIYDTKGRLLAMGQATFRIIQPIKSQLF